MSPLAFPKPSRVRERLKSKREHEREARMVRCEVWERDSYRCRVCRKQAAHIHHVVMRSRSKALRNTAANLVCLCQLCHSDAHAHRLHFSGNANTAHFHFERTA